MPALPSFLPPAPPKSGQKPGKISPRFVGGFFALWLILMGLVEAGAPDIAATLAGLILGSVALIYGPDIFGSILNK